MFALVDCNNFYVSCERAFDPGLIGKPVIVLSNNDGCAVSRSDEAKSLGIEMGTPPHLIPDLIKKHDIKLFSSNYTLYGDMSERVMKTMLQFVPKMEIYSIDEAFLDMSSIPHTDVFELGTKIRNTVMKNTSIPVCIGIAATKALAKMANRFIKKKNKLKGLHWAADQSMVDEMLQVTSVADVWGIGKQHALMLNRNNIKTAFEFVHAPEDFIRKHMSVIGLRLQYELKGIPSIPFEQLIPARKNICTGRSFGKFTSDKKLIREALSNFAANCALKLRQQKSVANEIKVFLNTNPHRTRDQQYFHSVIIQMDTATNSTPQIITYALKALDIIFKDGYNYKKCGVEMLDIIPQERVQLNIFSQVSEKRERIISATLDNLNKTMGKELVRFGIQGFEKKYKARAAYLSPCYTTKLEHIIKINN